MMPNAVLLTLIASPELEADLVDALSALADSPLLLASHLRGHNDTQHRLSVAEQVEGTRPLLRLSLQTDEATAAIIINHLAQHFAGAGIRWWCAPISSGVIA